ncbi:MAG: YfiR family protein [Cyanobacteriota bacterium]
MKLKIFFAMFFSLLIVSSVFAETMPVPIKIQTALFLKILSYDRSIKNDIKIGVLNGAYKADAIKSFQAISNEKIGSFSFSVVEVSDINSIKSKNIDVLYVTPDNKNKIDQINKITKSSGVLTLTGVPEYVENQGLSVAVEIKDGKPKILVNVTSSKKEKRDFSSQLLKLCRVIN